MAKTCAFKAEIREMLDLVIHSLYSKKEIFLRELISNASDAIDRARYLALTDSTIAPEAPVWQIRLTADAKAHTLIIEDNGVGMSAAELEDALGTIAKSGTKAFTEALKKGEETNIPELIGKFGVGFYAAFMVADAVTVDTLRRGEGQVAARWTSIGDGEYTLDDGSRTLPGTTITLHLREGMDEFAQQWTVRDLVRRYSDFIAYPIYLTVEGEEKKDDDKAEEEKPLNTMTALWKRPKSEIKPEDYTEFYKHISHDYSEPLKTLHIVAEGTLEYRALLFIPKTAGMELMMPGNKHGLSLYVRNVFIGDNIEELLPSWMRFLKGVVDSSDLPLNVSREMLQDDAIIRKIRSDITNRVLKLLAEMAKEKPEDYETFTVALGDFLKEGYHSDWENKEKLMELMRFRNLKDGKFTSFKAYREAMPEGQKAIYALTADTLQAAQQSPCLEALKAKGYDVLFLLSPVDQFIAGELFKYDEMPIVFADKGDLDLGEDKAASKKLDAAKKELQSVMDDFSKHLEATVKEVRLTSRLTDSPCCLVEDANALNPAMRRMMEAMGQTVPEEKRILELNPEHTLIRGLSALDEATKHDRMDLLYGQACLAEGTLPPNPAHFNQLLNALMAK